jgi:hypothetical protein
MENLAVYRGRFGDSTAAIEPNLHRAVSIECHSNPTAVEQRPAPIEADLSDQTPVRSASLDQREREPVSLWRWLRPTG